MNRRHLLASLPTLATARALLGAGASGRLGICTFSCHQHWKAVGAKHEGVKFKDTLSFARYVRELGADGVQTPLRGKDKGLAKQMRAFSEETGSYYEGELRLPKTESDLPTFESEVRLAREAGASVARAVFTSGRRYEVMKSLDDFHAFHQQAARSLELAEPVLRQHQLRLAVENHKDLTSDELAALMRKLSSEWIGVLVDTGNNLALLEDPQTTLTALAPFAASVHLKDMAVQTSDDGFLLSEVPLGTGALDLPLMISTLQKANPRIIFNLEMATRDPLHVPCLTDAYFISFPERKATLLDTMMRWVKTNPPKAPVPQMAGKSTAQQLAEEEQNNRHGLAWMHQHIAA